MLSGLLAFEAGDFGNESVDFCIFGSHFVLEASVAFVEFFVLLRFDLAHAFVFGVESFYFAAEDDDLEGELIAEGLLFFDFTFIIAESSFVALDIGHESVDMVLHRHRPTWCSWSASSISLFLRISGSSLEYCCLSSSYSLFLTLIIELSFSFSWLLLKRWFSISLVLDSLSLNLACHPSSSLLRELLLSCSLLAICSF